MKKNKFYAVKVGKKTGVFDNWEETKTQVENHSGAIYKSFSNPKDAWDFLRGNNSTKINLKKNNTVIDKKTEAIAYTDGSFDETTNTYSFGVVILWNDKTIKISKRMNNERDIELRNVAGELTAAMRAMKFAISNKIKSLTIYHDYEGVAYWAQNKWKANLPLTQEYKQYSQDVAKEIELNFVWVKGHSGDFYNEMVDQLAANANFDELRKVEE